MFLYKTKVQESVLKVLIITTKEDYFLTEMVTEHRVRKFCEMHFAASFKKLSPSEYKDKVETWPDSRVLPIQPCICLFI